MQNDPLTERIIGCCFEVHQQLGPGFQETIYHRAVEIAFKTAGLAFVREKSYKVSFSKILVGTFRVDLLVEDQVIVEIKASTGFLPKVFEAQVLSYLKAASLPVGLLVNFGNSSCQVRRLLSSP